MREYRFLLTLAVIALISSVSQSSIEAGQSSRRSRSYLISFIDYGIELPWPGPRPGSGGPAESSGGEEALFATFSFSDAGSTYNVQLYHRQRPWRIRARVLTGNRELRGLLNRFYRDTPNRWMDVYVMRKDGIPEMHLSSGSFLLKESSANTDAIYDAVEQLARQVLPQARNPQISVDPPPGLLRKTCRASVSGIYDGFYLVNEKGQVDLFTLENL